MADIKRLLALAALICLATAAASAWPVDGVAQTIAIQTISPASGWTSASGPTACGDNGGGGLVTSTTLATVGAGAKTFRTNISATYAAQITNSYATRAVVTIYDTDAPANYLTGTITTFTGTSMVVNVTATSGSGAFSTWTIAAAAPNGVACPAATDANSYGSASPSLLMPVLEPAIGNMDVPNYAMISESGFAITAAGVSLDPSRAGIDHVSIWLEGNTICLPASCSGGLGQVINPRTSSQGWAFIPLSIPGPTGTGQNGWATLCATFVPVNGTNQTVCKHVYLNTESRGAGYVDRNPATHPEMNYYADAVNGSDSYDGTCAWTGTTVCNGTGDHGPWLTPTGPCVSTAGSPPCHDHPWTMNHDHPGSVLNINPNGTYYDDSNVPDSWTTDVHLNPPLLWRSSGESNYTISAHRARNYYRIPFTIGQIDGMNLDLSKFFNISVAQWYGHVDLGVWISHADLSDLSTTPPGSAWCGETLKGCFNGAGAYSLFNSNSGMQISLTDSSTSYIGNAGAQLYVNDKSEFSDNGAPVVFTSAQSNNAIFHLTQTQRYLDYSAEYCTVVHGGAGLEEANVCVPNGIERNYHPVSSVTEVVSVSGCVSTGTIGACADPTGTVKAGHCLSAPGASAFCPNDPTYCTAASSPEGCLAVTWKAANIDVNGNPCGRISASCFAADIAKAPDFTYNNPIHEICWLNGESYGANTAANYIGDRDPASGGFNSESAPNTNCSVFYTANGATYTIYFSANQPSGYPGVAPPFLPTHTPVVGDQAIILNGHHVDFAEWGNSSTATNNAKNGYYQRYASYSGSGYLIDATCQNCPHNAANNYVSTTGAATGTIRYTLSNGNGADGGPVPNLSFSKHNYLNIANGPYQYQTSLVIGVNPIISTPASTGGVLATQFYANPTTTVWDPGGLNAVTEVGTSYRVALNGGNSNIKFRSGSLGLVSFGIQARGTTRFNHVSVCVQSYAQNCGSNPIVPITFDGSPSVTISATTIKSDYVPFIFNPTDTLLMTFDLASITTNANVQYAPYAGATVYYLATTGGPNYNVANPAIDPSITSSSLRISVGKGNNQLHSLVSVFTKPTTPVATDISVSSNTRWYLGFATQSFAFINSIINVQGDGANNGILGTENWGFVQTTWTGKPNAFSTIDYGVTPPAAHDTISANGSTWEFVDTLTTGLQIQRLPTGGSPTVAATMANAAAVMNASADANTSLMTYTVGAKSITATSKLPGDAGLVYSFVASAATGRGSSHLSYDGHSGAILDCQASGFGDYALTIMDSYFSQLRNGCNNNLLSPTPVGTYMDTVTYATGTVLGQSRWGTNLNVQTPIFVDPSVSPTSNYTPIQSNGSPCIYNSGWKCSLRQTMAGNSVTGLPMVPFDYYNHPIGTGTARTHPLVGAVQP